MSNRTGTYGIYRYILATFVVFAHLAPAEYTYLGYYAVYGFFALSGYLITQTLNTHYLQHSDGVKKFYINRMLRVFPTYWCVLILASIVLFLLPELSKQVHYRYTIPDNTFSWFSSIIVLGVTDFFGLRDASIIIPPAWSLAIELIFWAFMPYIAKDKKSVLIWFSISVAFILLLNVTNRGDSSQLTYYSPLGSSIAFSSGALLYFLPKKKIAKKYMALIFIITACYYYCGIYVSDKVYLPTHYLYGAHILNMLCIFSLSQLTFSNTFDKILGDISFPIFLSHIMVGTLVFAFAGDQFSVRSWPFFLVSLFFTNILSFILWYITDRKIASIRTKVKETLGEKK